MKKVVIIILLLFVVGCSVKEVDELSDSEKFASEYNISTNNPFKYRNYSEIVDVLNNTGIVFFASPDYEGSILAAELIRSVAKDLDIKEIYYYNPSKLKDKDEKKYNKLKDKFKDYLDNEQLNLPVLVSVENGEVIGYNNYFSIEKNLSEEKFTKQKKKALKEEYKKILSYEKKCTNCV